MSYVTMYAVIKQCELCDYVGCYFSRDSILVMKIMLSYFSRDNVSYKHNVNEDNVSYFMKMMLMKMMSVKLAEI